MKYFYQIIQVSKYPIGYKLPIKFLKQVNIISHILTVIITA